MLPRQCTGRDTTVALKLTHASELFVPANIRASAPGTAAPTRQNKPEAETDQDRDDAEQLGWRAAPPTRRPTMRRYGASRGPHRRPKPQPPGRAQPPAASQWAPTHSPPTQPRQPASTSAAGMRVHRDAEAEQRPT
eukprot:1309486-Rhodomonas_salina.2